MHDNLPAVEISGLMRKTKQRARSRFVQLKIKQLCSLSLTFVELSNQLVLSTLPEVQFLYNDININGHCIDLPKGFSMC